VPTYQYACTECDEQLEVRQSFTEDALTVCPACEGRLRKVFNAVGVVFKGSGFYKTDSRKPESTGRESGGGSGESGSKDSGSDKGSGSGKESGSKTSSDSPAKSGEKAASGSSGSGRSSAA
jgi:putative FmdB family regulatory protein